MSRHMARPHPAPTPFKLHPTEAQEAIWALHEGEADALVVRTPHGEDVYTLESINRPYRLFVEQMQEGALSVCNDGKILYCNDRFADMVGGLAENIFGRTLDEFVAESSLADYRELRERGSRQTARGECALVHAGGALLRVQMTFSQLRPLRIGHCAVIVTDLTHVERQKELTTAMESAEAANFAKDQFLAMLSHELRTPLTAVLGWTQMLRRNVLNERDAAGALEAIERNARAQMQLISDLLDVSRITAGKLDLDTQLVNPAEIASSAVESVAPAAKQKGVHLSFHVEERGTLIEADAARLQQAIANLLSNAVKFTPSGGKARLELKRVYDDIELTVSDTGQGISEQDLPKVFDRFQQVQGAAGHNAGLGLGLFITRQIVEKHGGRIWAFSDGPGKGSIFTMRLPVAELESEEGVLQPRMDEGVDAAPIALEGINVLVVDDAPDALSLMERALREAGAIVTGASSAAEAFEAIKCHQPDVLISDLDMPDENGFDFIRRVRREGYSGRNLPAVALTAMARREDRRRALLAGYQLHVAKPVDHDELIAAIAGVATLVVKPA
jgi:PAS domain S-box-containing protein